MTLEELTKVALIGTSRTNWSLPNSPEPLLEEAFAIARTSSPEDQLLAAAATTGAYEACGRSGRASPITLPSSQVDARQQCSLRAGELLQQILSMANAPAKQSLLVKWLTAADTGKRRPPHWHLPALLDYAASTRSVRDSVMAVIDLRGLWLMSLNPSWQFATAEDVEPASAFATGNRDQRLAVIRRLRETDASQARQMIGSTWKEDSADDRAAFVAAMSIGLSGDDEPFLESALDDRSKQVRAAAAELLSRVDGSAYSKRMIERVEPLVSFTPGTPAGMIKRAKPPRVEVQLPPEAFDPAWGRDAIVEKPAAGIGRRQWWLSQMLRRVPPAHWSAKWHISPADCFRAATGDFAEILVSTWSDAAEDHRDATWMKAAVFYSLDDAKQPVSVSMIQHMPASDQCEVIAKIFASPRVDARSLGPVLNDLTEQFSPELSELAIAAVERVHEKAAHAYDYTLPGLLDPLSHLLWPGVIDALMKRWTGDTWDSYRKTLDSFFQTLQIRRDIQAEFHA
jgi:hypothetical protein